MLRFSAGRNKVFRVKTNLSIKEKNWNGKKQCVIIPRMHTIEQQELATLQAKLDSLKNHLIQGAASMDDSKITKEWVQNTAYTYAFNNNEDIGKTQNTPLIEEEEGSLFFDLFQTFISIKCTNQNRTSQFNGLIKFMRRYEKIRGGGFKWSLKDAKDTDFADFENFLKNEHTFFNENGECIKHKRVYAAEGKFRVPKPRGQNEIYYTMKRLRTFWNWCIKTGRTTNLCLKQHTTKAPVYGTPFFITIEERDALYNHKCSTDALSKQRDIFIFQSCVGCRPGDLLRFTSQNIIENGEYLEYVPNKTVDEVGNTIRVPLIKIAKEIIERYHSNEEDAPLLPFISMQHYNQAIHAVFKEAGLDRMVTILNPTTRKEEKKPLYEVATAYMGRRNFIGNIYNKIQDPNLIGSMTGHVEGSKAFARYRKIDDSIKKSIISVIE